MALSKIKRHTRIRKKIKGTQERPRLSVFRSLRGMYVQIINDDKDKTLVGISDKSLEKGKSAKKMTKKEQAYELGKLVAAAAKKEGINTVVFDRGGNKYHGRVAELAKGAREGGLVF